MLSDLRLPGMLGTDLLRYVRLRHESLPFVMLTGVNDVPTVVRSMREGADEYLVKPVSPARLLQKLEGAVRHRQERNQVREETRQRLEEAEEAVRRERERASFYGFMRGVHTLVISLELADPYTKDHSKKVASAAVLMARRLGMRQRELREIRVGALLHDIGKIVVPREILHKEGPLTPEEWEIVRLHPLHGHDMLKPLGRYYPEVQRIVRHEHERWDGRGYPDGLKGEEIPLGSRLVMIADTYDAIISTRPYRPAATKADALRAIREGAGSQFDPDLIPAFEAVLPDLPGPRS